MKLVILLYLFLGLTNSAFTTENAQWFIRLDYLSTNTKNESKYETVRVPRIHQETIAKFYDLYSEDPNIFESDDFERRRIIEHILPHYENITAENQSLVIEQTIDLIEFSQLKSTQQMDNFLIERIAPKPFNEKVMFLGNFLGVLSDNYDLESLSSDDKEVPISDLEMLSAMENVLLTGEKTPIGVCRHMHQFAVRVARKIGMENAFGVGYNSINSGHRVLVLNVPGKRDEVVQLNYTEQIINNSLNSNNILAQDHSIPETGISLRIYDHKDQHVLTIPNLEGSVLNLITGGKNTDLGMAHQTNANIVQAGVKTKYGTFRIFKSQDSFNQDRQTQGASYNHLLNIGDFMDLKLGLAGFKSERIVSNGETLETKGSFFNLANEKQILIYSTEKMSLKAFNKLHLRLTYYCSGFAGEECKDNKDVFINNQTGIEFTISGEKFNNTASLIAENQYGIKHATFGADPNIVFAGFTFKNRLKIDYSDKIYGVHDIQVTNYDLANNGHSIFISENQIGHRGHDATLYHRYQNALDDKAPIWLPGSEEKSTYGVQKSFFGRKLKLSGHYTNSELTGGNIGLSIEFFNR